MADLDTLRPEVQEAMHRLENYLHITIDGKHSRSEDYDTIRAELVRLATIEADALIALDCEHDWQVEHKRAEKAEAELLRLAQENDAHKRFNVAPFKQELDGERMHVAALSARCNRAEAELAALKARIADAPTRDLFKYFIPENVDADVRHLIGKRVRLVVDEPAERGEG